jgi:nucleotide-binding universal stress UspA family protein
MITKVVVPLDGSPLAARAITPARSLAERTGASLLLMTAHRDDNVGEARERLDKQATELRFDRVETVIVQDRSAAEAIRAGTRDPNTVACMCTHGRSGLGQSMLGSVPEMPKWMASVDALSPGKERHVFVHASSGLVEARGTVVCDTNSDVVGA